MKRVRTFSLVLAALSLVAAVAGCCGPRSALPDTAEALRQQSVIAVLYLRTAAEARAMRYQAFNNAKRIVDDDLASGKPGKRAVVVDVDETILCNAPLWAAVASSDRPYGELEDEWRKAAQAPATAGSVEFLNHAVSKGVDVFYISNRKHKYLDVTMANLRKAGFPQINPSHVMLRKKTRNKDARRARVEKTHRIVLFMGDAIEDYVGEGLDKSVAQRKELVEKIKADLGRRFVVMPNPAQGHWLHAVNRYRTDATPEELIRIHMETLKPWRPGRAE